MNEIESLRQIISLLNIKKEKTLSEHIVDDDLYLKIKQILYADNVFQVEYDMDSCGRWSNLLTRTYKVSFQEEAAYFQLMEEIPATEIQEGNDFSYEFQEVEPYEVTITKFKIKGEN